MIVSATCVQLETQLKPNFTCANTSAIMSIFLYNLFHFPVHVLLLRDEV